MGILKYIQIAALGFLPICDFAQNDATKSSGIPSTSATDCPTWNTKKPTNRGSFLEYVRHSQVQGKNESLEKQPAISESTSASDLKDVPAASLATVQKESGNKNLENGGTRISSGKKQTSRLKMKLTRLFSKKTNRPAKPNYEKCTTRF